MQKQERQHLQIAIDGPAGAGKSTLARQVAQKLGIVYLDTGAMYRAVAWKARQQGIDPGDATRLTDLVRTITITFEAASGRLLCDGIDVTDEIRTPEVTAMVSSVSAVAGVRARLTELQRQEAGTRAIVLDGRDIGTYVLPQADVKIFLTAALEERARRRQQELLAKGEDVDFDSLVADIAARDCQDTERETAPLSQAADAHLLDTTDLTLDEVVQRVLALVEEANGHAL